MDDNFGFEDIEVSGAKRPGRKSAAQTPAKPSERKKGSSKNKPGSAGKGGSAITFSAKVVDALKNKVKEHNKKHPTKKVTLSQLKKVYRRGAGAFSQSHRPGMSRGGWAMARVNMFLKMKRGGKVKDSYRKADQDVASIRFDDLKFEDQELETSNSNIFDLTDDMIPSEEDFAQAAIDVDLYKLDYDFQDVNELYLDDYQPLGFEWE
tara:strand:+ start:107 stop:727 length:621 start_codon:yes stop_codon:yes gene_type:complete